MANLVTWIRPKDEKWFQPFFVKHPNVHVCDARKGDVSTDQMDGLLLTGGSDIAPEFLRQEIVDPTLIDKDADPVRDRWEFEAVSKSKRGALPTTLSSKCACGIIHSRSRCNIIPSGEQFTARCSRISLRG